MNERSIGRPMNRGVIHDVLVICDLDMDVESNRARRDAARQFVKQVILALGPSGCVVEMVGACLRRNAIPAMPHELLLVDKSEGGHAKIGFGRETRWTRLRRLHERERSRMRSQKGRRIPGRRGSEKIEKFLSRSGRESVRRMAHDVSMYVIGELETDRESARIRIGNVVGN